MGFNAGGPFRDLERVMDRLTDQFEDVEAGMPGRPSVDIEDTGGSFIVTVDLPGFEKDDIEIELREDTLTIDAEHDEERKQKLKEEYIRRERRHETVSRGLTLPEPIEEEETTATYENGVLTVELPKTRRESGTLVDVE